MTDKTPMRIEFAPGCFDNFEGTQQELDDLQREIIEMFERGEFEDNAQPLDMAALLEEDPDLAEELIRQLAAQDSPRRLQ